LSRKLRKKITRLLEFAGKDLKRARYARRGLQFGRRWRASPQESKAAEASIQQGSRENALRAYFDAHDSGHGIFKWIHYFDIYDRHLGKFRGKEIHIVEVGVYSGGSLEMWREYFGPRCTVYGVDVEEACKAYEKEGVRIFIGDQADRGFWRLFKSRVPSVDILIDDGGHRPQQQAATLEEMLPHLRPGGIYICEDVHGIQNQFLSYVAGLSRNLHAWDVQSRELLTAKPTDFQQAIYSVHLYPYVIVIEKHEVPPESFSAPRHGTLWQPFLAPRSRSAPTRSE
jgi:hypothetical protein